MIDWTPEFRDDGIVVAIRTDRQHPWNQLSPDYQHGQIPVPGLKGMYAECCTGVSQGLMLTGRRGQPGRINVGFFVGSGRTREIPRGHWALGYAYRGRCLDLVGARLNIAIPAYLWMLRNKAPQVVARLRAAGRDQQIWLYDGLLNDDLYRSEPMSHAALLAAYMNDDVQSFRRGSARLSPGEP